MSEGFEDTGRLHTAMTEATAHIGAITMDPARLRRARRRYRLAEGGAVAGVLSIALAATAIAMNTGPAKTSPGATIIPTKPSQSQTTAAAQPKTIAPIAVSVYDSDNGTEGKAMADQFLAGGGPWQTNQYCGSHATHDGLLKGTGLIFDLGVPTHPLTVSVDVALPGADMEVWAGDSTVTWPVPILQNQPPAGFMKAASVPASQSAGTNVFRLTGLTRYVLIWFSGTLPAVPNGDTTIKCAHENGDRYGDAIKAVKFTQG
jgi:hypothetical protein